MACLWAKDPPKFEDMLPPDEDADDDAAEVVAETEDERMTRKLDLVMTSFGGTMPAERPKAQEPAEDEFTKKMWRLMGVEG